MEEQYINKTATLTELQDRLQIFQERMENSFESVLSSIQSGNAEHLLAWTTIESTIKDIENQPTLLKPEVHFEPKLIFDRTKLQELLDALKDEVSVIEDFTACAENTFARGGGLHLAFLGGQHSFAINAHDAQKRRRSLGSDLFMVELEDKFGNKHATGVIEEQGDGKYSVTYAVPEDAETGSYMLNVCLRGAHINGSPFTVNVSTGTFMERFGRLLTSTS